MALDPRSLELLNGVGTTSDAHLDAKYRVDTLAQRDLLITQQQISRGHVIYFDNDSESGFPRGRYVLNTYPTVGSTTGVVWTEAGSGSGGASTLSDLTDVGTATPTNRHVLVGDGTDFDSRALVAADVSDFDAEVGNNSVVVANTVNVETLTAGEALVLGDIVYLNSDGKYHKASNANSNTTIGDLRIAIETIALDATGRFAKQIEVTIPSTTIPIGDIVYLGTNGGFINTTARDALASGSQVRRVGIIINSTTLYFDPDKTILELR